MIIVTIGENSNNRLRIQKIFQIVLVTKAGIFDTWVDFLLFVNEGQLSAFKGFIWLLLKFLLQYTQNQWRHLGHDKWFQSFALNTNSPQFGHSWIFFFFTAFKYLSSVDLELSSFSLMFEFQFLHNTVPFVSKENSKPCHLLQYTIVCFLQPILNYYL